MPPKKDPKKDAKGGKQQSKTAAKKSSGGGKAKKKKWSKGKVKDKLNNAVYFDKNTYDKMIKEVPKAKMITTSVLCDRLKVNVSIARRGIKELMAKGLIRQISTHASQSIYTRATAGA